MQLWVLEVILKDFNNILAGEAGQVTHFVYRFFDLSSALKIASAKIWRVVQYTRIDSDGKYIFPLESSRKNIEFGFPDVDLVIIVVTQSLGFLCIRAM